MSSVTISGNASGAGVLTIAAPNTASNFTLTLPVQTGTLVSGANANSVTLPGATSGTMTLAAPAVAGTSTLTLQAATATSAINTLATAVASTSGTSIDFTGLPAWVKKITLMFASVSTSGTSEIRVQLGTGSTTFATTGYTVTSSFIAASSIGTANGYVNGFQLYNLVLAADVLHGHIVFTNITGNTWVGSGLIGATNQQLNTIVMGSIALGAALTGVRVTTANGTDTFDAGTINILYEG